MKRLTATNAVPCAPCRHHGAPPRSAGLPCSSGSRLSYHTPSVLTWIAAYVATPFAAVATTAQTPTPVFAAFNPTTPASLPATLAGQRIELAFKADSSVRVTLDSMKHKDVVLGDFVYAAQVPAGISPALWALRVRPQTTGNVVNVGPAQATGFQVWNTTNNGAPGLIFYWSGVTVNAGNVIGFALRVTLGTTDDVARWDAIAGWEQNGTGTVRGGARMEEADYPITYLPAPCAPVGGESVYQAQNRGRFLVGVNVLQHPALIGSNNPMKRLFEAAGNQQNDYDFLTRHPGAHSFVDPAPQALQFAVSFNAPVAGVNDPGAGRMAYFGSEDAEGHVKLFHHRFLGGPGATQMSIGRWLTYPIPWSDPANGDVPTKTANTLRSRYPVVLGALRAKSDAFWYDACELYRSTTVAKIVAQQSLVPIENNTTMGQSIGPTSMLACLTLNVASHYPSAAAMYQVYADRVTTLRKAMENSTVPNTSTYLHVHNPLVGGLGLDEPAFAAQIDPGLAAIAQQVFTQSGIRTTAYSYSPAANLNDNAWLSLFPCDPRAYLSDGTALTSTSSGGTLLTSLDFANPCVAPVFGTSVFQAFAAQKNLSGLYLDYLAGPGPLLTYDPPTGAPTHLAGRGDLFLAGQRAMLDATRTAMANNNALLPPGTFDPNVLLTGEVTQEFLAHHLNGAPHGKDYLSGHMLLLEKSPNWLALNKTHPGLSAETVNLSVPLWNCVYHEYAPALSQCMAFSNAGLATSGLNQVQTIPAPGMSSAQFRDLYCFAHALLFAAGSKPTIMSWFGDWNAPLAYLDASGNVAVDRIKDPDRVGLTVLGFLRTMFTAQAMNVAGQFQLYGRMLRPLTVDYADAEVQRAPNPMASCTLTSPILGLVTYPTVMNPVQPHINAGLLSLATDSFEVPRVLASMWQSQTGTRALILTNWTAATATWAGTFDPALYGFTAGQPYSVKVVLPNGTKQTLGTFTGPVTLHTGTNSAPPTGHLYLGDQLALSARVFTFE